MKARIAVVTVSGRAYYIIVNELKRKNIPFLSLTPHESVPIGIKVVITTEAEKRFVNHERVLTYRPGVEPSVLANEALQVVQGKETFEKVVIGVDPGEVFGLAVLASGRVVETDNCYGVKDALSRIESMVRDLENMPVASISVKIGNGVPECEEKLLRALDKSLPKRVTLESVREEGTDSRLDEAKHRRGLRDIVSAIQIAGRTGQTYRRRKTDESYGRKG
jgi:hypothetical protein